MGMVNKKLCALLLSYFCFCAQYIYTAPVKSSVPQLTIIFVIDQFAAHYLTKLDGYLHDGLHTLLKNGVVYTNAFYPHAALETAVGHTTLGTGALPGGPAGSGHGIVANSWITPDEKSHALTGTSIH